MHIHSVARDAMLSAAVSRLPWTSGPRGGGATLERAKKSRISWKRSQARCQLGLRPGTERKKGCCSPASIHFLTKTVIKFMKLLPLARKGQG